MNVLLWLKRQLLRSVYDPAAINPGSLSTHLTWPVSEETKALERKLEARRQWMREQGIEPPEVKKREVPGD